MEMTPKINKILV